MALLLQAALLLQNAPAAVAHAVCVTRLAADRAFSYGAVPAGVDLAAILRRQTEP